MIAFFGRADDPPLGAAIEEAASRGAPHLILDQGGLDLDEVAIDVGPDRVRGRLRNCGMEIGLDEIAAVYARPLALPPFRDRLGQGRAERFNALFLEWLDDAECVVVNRPAAMLSNGSKPYQIQLIAAAGLEVPETLVTNRPQDVRDFHRRHGRVVYKSISGIRSIVRDLDAAGLDRLDRVRSLPTQFQAHVEGVDVRVHVVGGRCFATEIASAATDYRYAHRDGGAAPTLEATELPAAVHAGCVAVAARLDLPFCGIDLRRRPDGSHVCFEVNPMPAYSYFAHEAGQPIAAALIDLLADPARDTVGPWSRFATT